MMNPPTLDETRVTTDPDHCIDIFSIPNRTNHIRLSHHTTAISASHRSATDNRAKSKNSSQHNQVRKAHRNGIKKPKTNKYPSLRGVDPKFVRNQRYAKHGTEKALKAARAEA